MNLCLLQKEIAGLKLVLWLFVVILGLECVYVLTTGFPDFETAEERAKALDNQVEEAVFEQMLMGMLIGLYLFGQEREHKTTPFLDGLPVRRSTLFYHKFVAACCVVGIMVVAIQVYEAIFRWLSSDSLSRAVTWSEVLAQGGVEFLLGYAVVGVATLISFARKWFPLIAGLVLWTIVLVRSSESSLSGWIDTPQILRWAHGGTKVPVPWEPILGHVVIGSLGWVGALIGFQYRDGFLSRQVEKIAQWRLASWAIAVSQLTAAFVWLFAMVTLSDQRETPSVESLAAGVVEPSKNPQSGGPIGFGRESTEYYEVVFRESQRKEVNGFIGWLDGAHEQVRELLDDPPVTSAKIVLDTASPVMSHTSGQTNWTKIRVPLALAKDEWDLCRTVRHETAHVFIEQLSGGRARDEFNAMRLFHEGLASLAEFADDIHGTSEQHILKERWACGVDSRGRVPFHILCDDERLVKLRDPDVVYPLGYVVAHAMLDAGGPTLPKRFLEALKTTPIAPGTKPVELWRLLLQKCQSSLDLVIAQYEARLDTLAQREQEFLAALPSLTATVLVQGDDILIRVTPTAPASPAAGDAYPICMVERDRFLTKLPEQVAMVAPGEFRLAKSRISGNQFRLLIGWITPKSEGPIYQPWQEIEL